MAGLRFAARAAAAALAALLFAQSLGFEFTLDDRLSVLSNADVQGGGEGSLWTHDYWGTPLDSPASHKSYRPLTVLSFAANRVLGNSTVAFHAANLALHAGVSALVVAFAEHLGAPLPEAAAAGLLFAAHPAHVEAVANVSGRAELLAALLALLALLAWRRALRDLSPARCAAALGAAFAAALCKEVAAVVFGIMLLDAWLSLRGAPLLGGTGRPWAALGAKRQRRAKLLVASAAAAAALFLQWRLWMAGDALSPSAAAFDYVDNPLLYEWSTYPLHLRVANAALTAVEYARLLLWPQRLCYDYSFPALPPLRSLSESRAALAAAALVLGGAAALWVARRGSETQTLLAALLIAPLLPALNLLFPVGTVVAERVTYLPSVALCVLLAGLLLSHGPRHGLPLVVAIVAMFSARTLSYTRVWRDDETLSREALAAQPSSAKVQFNAGFALSSRGQVAESLPYYAEAAELDPSSFDTLMALGVLNDKIGRVDEARRWFARAAAVDCASPQHAAAGNKCANTKLRALRTIVPFFQRHGPPDAMGELRARFESAMAEAMGS